MLHQKNNNVSGKGYNKKARNLTKESEFKLTYLFIRRTGEQPNHDSKASNGSDNTTYVPEHVEVSSKRRRNESTTQSEINLQIPQEA